VLTLGCGGDPARRGKTSYDLDYPAPKAVTIPVTRFTLKNGLEVLVQEDHGSPHVAVNVWYHVGSAQEPPGHAGMAHFCEHLMFDGSAHVKPNQHAQLLKSVGGFDMNATTNSDRTNYYETVPKGALETALWLESDRMGFLRQHLDPAEFDRERSVVKNELHQRYDNVANGWVHKFVQQAMFPPQHPYAHLTIGEVSELDGTKVEDARAFMGRYYVPNNASLVLVGDVKAADAKVLVEKYFGDIPAGAPVPLPTPNVPVLGKEKRIRIESDTERAEVIVAWPLPPALSPGLTEMNVGAFGIASWKDDGKLLDGRNVSVDDREIATIVTVTFTVANGRSSDAVLSEFDDYLHKMRSLRHRFDRTQFSIIRATSLSRFAYNLDTFSSRADTLNESLWMTGGPDLTNRLLAEYRDVTVEDVRDAYYQFLDFDNRVVAFVTPSKGAPRAGRVIGGGK
jgi:predicted Zn-dependent peptidase